MSEAFIIASLKHTGKHHEHITFWGPDWRGYVLAITDERVGKYKLEEVQTGLLNDGEACIAVPEAAVKALLSPTPYYRNSQGVASQFYDIPGPVVDNTRANWNALIKASLLRESKVKPKPEVFQGTRRSFALLVAEQPVRRASVTGARPQDEQDGAAPSGAPAGEGGV